MLLSLPRTQIKWEMAFADHKSPNYAKQTNLCEKSSHWLKKDTGMPFVLIETVVPGGLRTQIEYNKGINVC